MVARGIWFIESRWHYWILLCTLLFDLDHTVIDSSHRQITRPDGSLDLAAWIKNNTAPTSCADTLLPLAAQWRLADKERRDHRHLHCARNGRHDYDFLAATWPAVGRACLSRRRWRTLPDADLKETLIRKYAIGSAYVMGAILRYICDFLMTTPTCSKCLTARHKGL